MSAARRDDLPTIDAFRRALRAEEARRGALASLPRHRDAGRPEDDGAPRTTLRRDEVIFIARVGTCAVGMLRCGAAGAGARASARAVAWVSSVYVEPATRRRGVLRALIASADAWCRTRGHAEMRLHCAVENAAANTAWESLGFAAAKVLRRRTVPGV